MHDICWSPNLLLSGYLGSCVVCCVWRMWRKYSGCPGFHNLYFHLHISSSTKTGSSGGTNDLAIIWSQDSWKNTLHFGRELNLLPPQVNNSCGLCVDITCSAYRTPPHCPHSVDVLKITRLLTSMFPLDSELGSDRYAYNVRRWNICGYVLFGFPVLWP